MKSLSACSCSIARWLGAVDRTLPCKWFYDAAGSELFAHIRSGVSSNVS